MSHVFISYRRDDSAATCGRIYDRLVSHFGREAIFIDVDNIPLGVNFEQYITGAMEQCSVLLAVIGTRWLEVVDAGGQPRLNDPNDVVRLEIEAALRRQIPVIPILVQGAQIPSADRLPESLLALRMQNGLPVRDDRDFDNDMRHLATSLERWIPRHPDNAQQQATTTGQQPFQQPPQQQAGGAQQPAFGQSYMPPPASMPPQPMAPQPMPPAMGAPTPTTPSFGQAYAGPATNPGTMGTPGGQYVRPGNPSVPMSTPVTPMPPAGGPTWGQAPGAQPQQPMPPRPMPPQPMQMQPPPMAPMPAPMAPQPMAPPSAQPYNPALGGGRPPARSTNVGLIIGIVAGVLVLVCVGSLILVAALGSTAGTSSTTSTSHDWKVVLNSTHREPSLTDYTPASGDYIVLADVGIENQSSTSKVLDAKALDLQGTGDQHYQLVETSDSMQSANVDPGHAHEVVYAFEVPASECSFTLTFLPDNSNQWTVTFPSGQCP